MPKATWFYTTLIWFGHVILAMVISRTMIKWLPQLLSFHVLDFGAAFGLLIFLNSSFCSIAVFSSRSLKMSEKILHPYRFLLEVHPLNIWWMHLVSWVVCWNSGDRDPLVVLFVKMKQTKMCPLALFGTCFGKCYVPSKFSLTCVIYTSRIEPSLSDKDQMERARRSQFVQGLVLSTIFDDTLWAMSNGCRNAGG